MSDKSNDDETGRPRIELEPLVTRADESRYVVNDGESSTGRAADAGQLVPEAPSHLCPACDYLLTGLTSRRCPECGRPFTLAEARRHGHWAGPAGMADKKELRKNHIFLMLGGALWLAGILAPWIGAIGAFSTNKVLHFFIGGYGGCSLLAGAAWKIYYQRTWPEAVMFAGIVSSSIGIMLVILLF